MMTDKWLRAYRVYQRFLRIVLTMGGCWYMPTKSGKSTYYWPFFVLFIQIIYATINLHLSYIYRRNLGIMMKSVGIVITIFGTILKVVTVLINRDSLINYHRTLNDLFEEELARNEKIRTIMFSSLAKICILAYTYCTMMIVVVMSYFTPAYLFIIRDLCHFRLTTNYTLPISRGYGYFWTVPDNILYHFHLLFETCAVSMITITACGMDSVFGFYVYQFASTMHAMTFRLTNPLTTEKFLDILKECVGKHQKLLQCRDTLEHIYGTIVFWHIVTNAVLLCTLIYDFWNVNVNNLFVSLTYGMIKLLQTFTYAWYGTLLTNASEDFRNGIYFSEWPNSVLDRHVRTNVVLIMMQKPMTINAFFSPVNVVMFTNFVNTTVSYFFLLQSVGDKGD